MRADKLEAAPAARTGVGQGLDRAAWVTLAAMPLALSFVVRSSAALITIAALLALLGAAQDGRAAALIPAAGRRLRIMPGVLAPVLVALAAVSLLWHPFPDLGLFAMGEGFTPLVAALALGLCLGRLDQRAMFGVFACMFGLAAIEVSVELWTGMAWREALGARTALFVLNKPVICLVILYWPLWALSEGQPRRGLVMGVLAALMAAATFRSVSGAAMLGLACAAAAFWLALLAPRLTWGLVMLGMFAALALAPFKGELAHRLIPDQALERLASLHARDRVEIWRSFGEVVRIQPWTGAGFGASPRMGDAPVAALVPEERRTLLAVGHPHDMFLQVWTELGAVGALLAALAIAWLARATRLLPPRRLAPVLACLAAVLVIAEVGHGAWQGWWVAILGAAAIWFGRFYASTPASGAQPGLQEGKTA